MSSHRADGFRHAFRRCLMFVAVVCFAASAGAAAKPFGGAAGKPNIIFILADDLGYADLGCYGQRIIQTPHIDRMAAEGMKFTRMYAGATVCAPSRSVLMTGQHLGHTWVRGNGRGARQSLREKDVTVAERLKSAGYDTALIGKWGLGDEGGDAEWTGRATNQGFDTFFGYLNQHHAHNYYPAWLWENDQKVKLDNVVPGDGPFGQGWATKRVTYSHDLFADRALQWVREHKGDPFFLYLSLTIPHANNEGSRGTGNGAEVPDHGIYSDKDWPDPDKGQAAMITRMDKDVGRLLDLLGELDIAKNTLVIFTSDNGPHNEARHNMERFNPAGPLRGMKRDLTEGGIRVPFIAWWPGTIQAGTTSDHIGYFGDFMATACELAGVETPTPNDSISLVPTLTGKGTQKQHKYLYWEFYERGSKQAVRAGKWKAIRKPMVHGPIELYNLDEDLAEQHNLADQHPDVVERMQRYMKQAHEPHPNWRVPKPKNKG